MSSVDRDAVAYAEHAKKTSRSEVERAQIEKSRKDDIQGNKSSIKKNYVSFLSAPLSHLLQLDFMFFLPGTGGR